jgi:hypothetical protein
MASGHESGPHGFPLISGTPVIVPLARITLSSRSPRSAWSLLICLCAPMKSGVIDVGSLPQCSPARASRFKKNYPCAGRLADFQRWHDRQDSVCSSRTKACSAPIESPLGYRTPIAMTASPRSAGSFRPTSRQSASRRMDFGGTLTAAATLASSCGSIRGSDAPSEFDARFQYEMADGASALVRFATCTPRRSRRRDTHAAPSTVCMPMTENGRTCIASIFQIGT